MKTDNKEEAKRFIPFGDEWKKEMMKWNKSHIIDLLKKNQTDRFHHETFERVEKPDINDYDLVDYNEKVNFEHALNVYQNALTLDQLIERCKEMRDILDKVQAEVDSWPDPVQRRMFKFPKFWVKK